jgi:hypothetical protein
MTSINRSTFVYEKKFLISGWRHAILDAASLVEINHKIFFIFAFFVVMYLFQLLYLSALRWDLNVDLGFMLVFIIPLLLDAFSL